MTPRKTKRRFENYLVKESLPAKSMGQTTAICSTLLLIMAMVKTTGVSAYQSLCDVSKTVIKEMVVTSAELNVSSLPFNASETNEEWIFFADEKSNLLNIKFSKFELAGPICVQTDQPGIAKLYVKTDLDENWYCKGRREPDDVSGKSYVQVSYCGKHPGGQISFRVISNSTKDSLLPDRKPKLCNFKGIGYEEGMNFSVTSRMGSKMIVIKHRRADFALSFQLVGNDLSERTTASEITTMSGFTNATNLSAGTYGDSGMPQSKTGLGHIIGIGCGGIFILGILILALIFVRRKKSKRGKRESTRSSRKTTRTILTTRNGSPHNGDSIGSINNVMYDQVLNENNRNVQGNIATSFQERRAAGHVLERVNTRPQLPPPSVMPMCRVGREQSRPRASNIYESVDDMQLLKGSGSRPMSRATFTSDEFSDDDGLSTDRCHYSVVMTSPLHASDPTLYEKTLKEETRRIGDAPSGFSLLSEQMLSEKSTPQINIHAVTTPAGYTSINSSDGRLYNTPSQQKPNERSSLSVDGYRYDSPRPSPPRLPQMPLAEDAENYLSPRPSCPDVMAINGYSSTDDVNDIRKRLLASAHPSLLFTSRGSSASVPEAASHYDSPKTVGQRRPSAQYAAPRRKHLP